MNALLPLPNDLEPLASENIQLTPLFCLCFFFIIIIFKASTCLGFSSFCRNMRELSGWRFYTLSTLVVNENECERMNLGVREWNRMREIEGREKESQV